MQLSHADKIIHENTLALSRKYKRVEAELVLALQEVASRGIHKKLGRSNLNRYAVIELELSEAVAQCFVTVANKARKVSALQKAIETGSLSVSKASRIVSALTHENAKELVDFAIHNSCRKTQFEVARINPKAAFPSRIIPISEDMAELRICIRMSSVRDLERVQSLIAQQRSKSTDLSEAVESSLKEYCERHDPVRKAERAMRRNSKQNLDRTGEHRSEGETNVQRLSRTGKRGWNKIGTQGMNGTGTKRLREATEQMQDRSHAEAIDNNLTNAKPLDGSKEIVSKPCTFMISDESEQALNRILDQAPKAFPRRVPLTAEQRHSVNVRDQGRCTYCDSSGKRCDADQWVEIHHVIHVKDGGTNDPSNLTTLCWFHHDLVHQLSFDFSEIESLRTG